MQNLVYGYCQALSFNTLAPLTPSLAQPQPSQAQIKDPIKTKGTDTKFMEGDTELGP